MKKIEVTALGDPDVLRLVDAEVPEPLPTEILVRVHGAGVNPVDWKTRAGGGVSGIVGLPPFGLGWDVSGVVEAVGPGVTRFGPGDEVFGMPWFPREASAYAEYVTAPSRQLARKPDRLDHRQAGGLPLAGLTAWQALIETVGLTAGQRILVVGAGGGVGHLAVQIATALGCYVIGAARREKHDFLRELGSAEVIDHHESRVGHELAGSVDVVIDLVGGETGLDAIEALGDSGTYLAVPSADATNAELARTRGHRAPTLLVEPDRHGLEEIARLVASGDLRVEVEASFPLASAADAHRHGELGRTRGKLVLEP